MERDPLTPRSKWMCHGYVQNRIKRGSGYFSNWHGVVSDDETRWYRCTCSPLFKLAVDGTLRMRVPSAFKGGKTYSGQTRWLSPLSNMKSYLRRYSGKVVFQDHR